MTFFHFGNCVALACAPYFLTYKLSGLSEYGVFWKCIQAGAVYLLTQLCKMLFLATFFPATESAANGVDVIGETFKATVDFADLIGIHFVMSQVAGKGELKCLVVGLGWASAELIMTQVLPLWVGARGTEFDWKYMQMSFESNISLMNHIATATLVWLWSRNDLKKSLFPLIAALLVLTCYKPLIAEILSGMASTTSWTILAFKLILALGTSLTTLLLYVGFNQSTTS
ncbi:hypothetical protein CHUAL_001673 [Chamberlinius hualienensis]